MNEENKIIQSGYGEITFDTRESDIVMIWQLGDVIQIERESLKDIIEILQSQL